MFKNVVVAEIIEGEGGRVCHWVGGHGKVKEKASQRLVDVEGVEEGILGHLSGDILAMMRQEPVIGEGVEHRAWRSHWGSRLR